MEDESNKATPITLTEVDGAPEAVDAVEAVLRRAGLPYKLHGLRAYDLKVRWGDELKALTVLHPLVLRHPRWFGWVKGVEQR